MNNGKLTGQSALVTGASTGLGKSIAVELAKEGAAVVVNYVNHAELAVAVVQEITDAGGRAIAIQADISDEAQVISLFAQAIKEFGTLDILVNNAGIQLDAPLLTMTLQHRL